MKTLTRPTVVAPTLIFLSLLLSWMTAENLPLTSDLSFSLSQRNTPRDGATSGLVAADESPQSDSQLPVAEDVLVKKIPGDNGHLLLMAYYSKENFAKPSFTLINGTTITFLDDGTGDDKVAGDGLYTGKIPADIAAFRSQALGLSKKMKDPKYELTRYINRQLIVDPGAGEDFEIQKFDANEPVSIAGLTNALSGDFRLKEQDAVSAESPLGAIIPTLEAIKRNSIFITDLSVVEDPKRTWNFIAQTGNAKGPWTFNTLIRNLASKNLSQIATDKELSDFVKKWLNQFATQQIVNGDVVAGRPLLKSVVLDPWLQQSQSAGAPAGQLDMRFAPFKLTAITNRFDLRDGEAFGNGGQPCGEGRFVFTLIASKDFKGENFDVKKGDPLRMTIIFEARVNKQNSCSSKRNWAQQWVNLANLPLPSPQYNDALQKITDQFSAIGNTPNAPNQNSLSQLRTNEVALESLAFGAGTWELREFNLVNNNNTGSNGKGRVDLKMATDKMAPADKFNGAVPTAIAADVQRMADFVNQNTTAINTGFYSVPDLFQGSPFLGAVSKVNGFPVGGVIPGLPGFHWNSTGPDKPIMFITDDNARFNFSMQTCSGCHAGESQTFFTHVDNVGFGQQATLSGFVTGKRGLLAKDADGDDNNGVFSVQDPAQRPSGNPTIRSFNEIDRRAKDLLNVVNTSCGTPLSISSELLFRPIPAAH